MGEHTGFLSKCGIRLCCETEWGQAAAAAAKRAGAQGRLHVVMFLSSIRTKQEALCLHREAQTETLSST